MNFYLINNLKNTEKTQMLKKKKKKKMMMTTTQIVQGTQAEVIQILIVMIQKIRHIIPK